MRPSEAIYRKRTALCWSQKELAEAAGVAHMTVFRLESGRSVTMVSLSLVLDALCLELQVVERKPK